MDIVLNGQFGELTVLNIAYDEQCPEEILFVQMDREVYYPGDTVWFKVYLRNKASLPDRSPFFAMAVIT